MRMIDQHTDPLVWDETLAQLPGAHILQTWDWASLKQKYGWSARPVSWQDEQGKTKAAAMVLLRSLPAPWSLAGLRVMYVPKGPICDWERSEEYLQVLNDLADLARKERAIFIKIDADVCLGSGIPGNPDASEYPAGQQVVKELSALGWRMSAEQVQFRNTVKLDLSQDLDEILAKMKQKTRYNVRLASRKGVSVRQGNEGDFSALYRLYAETSERDGFVIRDREYYLELWKLFYQTKKLTPLVAVYQGNLIAGLMLFHFAGKAYYLHGMSAGTQRELMPNYLLQWEAIRTASHLGCQSYDLWGAPDVFDETDSMWGVYRFKEGLGGRVYRHIGAWDLPTRQVSYHLYTQILPKILEWMRSAGRARTHSSLQKPAA